MTTTSQMEQAEAVSSLANFFETGTLVLLVVALTMGIVLGLDKTYGYFENRKKAVGQNRANAASVRDEEEE